MSTLLSPHDHRTHTSRHWYEHRTQTSRHSNEHHTNAYIRTTFIQALEEAHMNKLINHYGMLTITI